MKRILIDTESGLTNQQVGELIGLTYSAVSRLRSGDRLPSIPTMYNIEVAFGWPVADQLEMRTAHGATAYSTHFDRLITEYTSR